MRRRWLAVFTLAWLSVPAFAQQQNEVGWDKPMDAPLVDSEPVEDAPEDAPTSPATAAAAAPLPLPPVNPGQPAAPMIEQEMAVLQGLKKVTAETMAFEAPVDAPIRFGSLTITVKKCMMSRPEDEPENTALMLIRDNRPGEDAVDVFFRMDGFRRAREFRRSSIRCMILRFWSVRPKKKPAGDDPSPPPAKAK